MDQKTEDELWDKRYNEKDFAKTTFSFTPSEIAKLAPWDSQIQIGQFASIALTGVIRRDCLKRVGVKDSTDTGIRYDISTGQFFVYQPRIWCSQCNNKRAEFSYNNSYNNKVYCGGCIEILKQQSAQSKPKEEKKKSNKH